MAQRCFRNDTVTPEFSKPHPFTRYLVQGYQEMIGGLEAMLREITGSMQSVCNLTPALRVNMRAYWQFESTLIRRVNKNAYV